MNLSIGVSHMRSNLGESEKMNKLSKEREKEIRGWAPFRSLVPYFVIKELLAEIDRLRDVIDGERVKK